ncbi:MAG: AAA family ATPase [Sphingopyxis sp.]
MSSLRLKSARIQGFRRLSEPMNIDFGGEAGITILVGPNGSGKSTVLDGVEWALTGSASRLPNLSAADARRAPDIFKSLGSEIEPAVTLTFFDAEKNRDISLSPGAPAEEIAALLRRTEHPWRDLKTIDTALQWTHFSSQRSVARLGYENGDAIMKAFAAPAGLDKLKGLDRRLWGSETRKELRRLRSEAAEAARRHKAAYDHVERLLHAPQASEIRRAERRIADLVATLAKEHELDFSGIGTSAELLEKRLLEHRSSLESRLAEVRRLTAERRDASVRARRLEVEAEAARQTLETTEKLQKNREEAVLLAEQEAAKVRSGLAELNLALSKLQERQQRRERLAGLDARTAVLRDQASDLRLQIEDAEIRLRGVTELEGLVSRVRAGQEIADLRKFEASLLEFGDPEEVAREGAIRVAELSARRDTLSAERAAAQASLAHQTERAELLRSLAAALAGHLTEHDTDCPVCAAHYTEGELVNRSRKALAEFGTASRELTRLLQEKTQELGQVSGRLQFFSSRVDEANQLAAKRARYRSELDRLTEIFGAAWTDEAQEQCEARLIDLRDELELDEDTPLRGLRSALENRRRRDIEVQTALGKELSDITALRADIETVRPDTDDPHEMRAELRLIEERIERETARLTDAAAEHRLAVELLEAATQSASKAGELLQSDTDRAKEERRRFRDVDRLLSKIFGGLDESAYTQSIQEQSVRIGAALDRLAAIRAEEEKALHSPNTDQELGLLRASYMPANSRADAAALHEVIGQLLAEADAHVGAIDLLEKRLRDRARHRRDFDNRIHGTALKPWNALFRQVYATLAGSLGETLEWTPDRVDMRYGELDSHAVPRVDDLALHGWMAGHFFSEGQLAALQISAMITASVLLPWSRWQALMFDDPLQHADVIKVGAFADLMRSLCQDKGHQIIMTTHDQTQADFLHAKFSAAGLSARVIQFKRSRRSAVQHL